LALQSAYTTILNVLGIRARVITAILLRDMRTRFGRTHLTYLVAIGWPLSHVVGMVATFILVNRMLPFGSDSTIFISTGALPYVLCLYPARMMGFTILANGTALNFPIVHPIDLIISRLILEGLTAFSVALIFVMGLWAVDVDVTPIDVPTALTSMYAAVFFGLSIGTFGLVLRALLKTPGYIILVMTLIGCYMSSGVYLPITPTTETLRTLVGFNPIYQLVQWTRSAYFEVNNVVPLDKSYVLMLSCFLLLLGLAGERLFRGKILAP
jgi:capsular polysaccharide transport system permease protein